jgi:hypothetical protein
MLSYVQYTLNNKANITPPNTGTWQLSLLAHWNSLFAYVGYTGVDQPSSVPVDIFGPDGAVGVISQQVASQELAAANAALTMYQQDANGDQRDHLFVIYPQPANCLGTTSLKKNGPCFEFATFPKVSDFSPKIKVGICQPLHEEDDAIADHLNVPAIGHLAANVTRITSDVQAYPTFCGHIASVPAGSWTGGFGNVTRRLAWVARQAFTPQPLFAVHGGLGGLGGTLSPHQAVDLRVFRATFDDDAIGSQPGQPGVGSFTTPYFVTPPGSITVRASLGEQNSPLAVLSQGGGNCVNCGGLLLEGNLATDVGGVYATEGVYDAEWISLQDGPTMKEAKFILRSSNGSEIARVVYATKSSANTIRFNNSNTVLAAWVRHVPQHFRVRVNLDTKATTLWIDGVQKATGTFSALNFATISADFRGIDSGTMGWDEINVERLPGT